MAAKLPTPPDLLPKPQLVEEVLALREEVARLREGWSERDDLLDQLNEALVELANAQGELRTQNDELRQAHAALESQRRRYAELYEDAPVGYVSLDRELHITEANLTASRLLSRDRAQMIDGSILRYVDADDAVRFREHVRAVFEGQRAEIEITVDRGVRGRLPLRIDSVPEVDDRGQVVMCRSAATDVTEWKRVEEELEHLAHHDPLTGLSNRALFQDRLAHAIESASRDGRDIGLMYLDLDSFKAVNDTLGHSAGDALLQQVARRLQRAVRSSDTVARFGGDEFLVLLERLKQRSDVEDVARKALAVLRAPFDLNGQRADISVSLGISVFPRDGRTARTLMRKADLAMYQAKQEGKNRAVAYKRSMNRQLRERTQITSKFRRALLGGELELHFQPIVTAEGGKPLFEEALVRWATPPGEMLLPAVFLPIAEELGLMEHVARWGLEEVCGHVKSKPFLDWPVRVSLNLAASQIGGPGLPKLFEKAIAAYGVPGEHLAVEITEHSIIQDIASAMRNVERLRELGVSILLDDFGTGYCSLAYLKQLPIDFLKIDATFVRHLPTDRKDAAIVDSIVRLAHDLGVGVIAEGVETQAQLECVKALGCDAVQGHLVGSPRRHRKSDLHSRPAAVARPRLQGLRDGGLPC